jgi:hypothetical protein
MKKFKKLVAGLLAVSSMALCMTGISASADSWSVHYTKGRPDSANKYISTGTLYSKSSATFECSSYSSTTGAKAYVSVSSTPSMKPDDGYLDGKYQTITCVSTTGSTATYVNWSAELKSYSGGTSSISGTVN